MCSAVNISLVEMALAAAMPHVSSPAGDSEREASITPGSKVAEWKIRVDEAKGWVKIGRNKSSISKLRQH